MFAYTVQSGCKAVCCINLARAEVCIGVINLIYNMLLFAPSAEYRRLEDGEQGERLLQNNTGKHKFMPKCGF
ncbi:hypothetical protein [Methylomicrobium sp. Wu6]|uniref:hypothetical protein n=1 Tax=Methylomicrobium sp. Wu6 TaxID=3107928 RepID=UPI002DD66F6F|nr:hypothetical protein [Methylomicrobium sp. Wu6]MEC4750508.1 hypothetical protein [Methylomicrobium sp. Wu6]